MLKNNLGIFNIHCIALLSLFCLSVFSLISLPHIFQSSIPLFSTNWASQLDLPEVPQRLVTTASHEKQVSKQHFPMVLFYFPSLGFCLIILQWQIVASKPSKTFPHHIAFGHWFTTEIESKCSMTVKKNLTTEKEIRQLTLKLRQIIPKLRDLDKRGRHA